MIQRHKLELQRLVKSFISPNGANTVSNLLSSFSWAPDVSLTHTFTFTFTLIYFKQAKPTWVNLSPDPQLIKSKQRNDKSHATHQQPWTRLWRLVITVTVTVIHTDILIHVGWAPDVSLTHLACEDNSPGGLRLSISTSWHPGIALQIYVHALMQFYSKVIKKNILLHMIWSLMVCVHMCVWIYIYIYIYMCVFLQVYV